MNLDLFFAGVLLFVWLHDWGRLWEDARADENDGADVVFILQPLTRRARAGLLASSRPLLRVHGAAFRAVHAQNVSPEEGGSGEDFPRLDDLDRPADAVPGGGASEGRASRNCFDFDASACDVADVQIAVP